MCLLKSGGSYEESVQTHPTPVLILSAAFAPAHRTWLVAQACGQSKEKEAVLPPLPCTLSVINTRASHRSNRTSAKNNPIFNKSYF